MSVKTPTRQIEEANRAHVELNRLYEMAKGLVETMKPSIGSNDSKKWSADVNEAQRLLRAMQLKNNFLKGLAKEVSSNDRQKIDVNVQSHEKQINSLQRQLKAHSDAVGKGIAAEERHSLLLKRNGSTATGNTKIASHEERSIRLQELVSKMSQQVESGEQSMSSLVHSSSVLGQTQSEYESQTGHILTGSKLLSKYEQREFTEKFLLVFFFLLYFGVVYYILQKRIIAWFWIF